MNFSLDNRGDMRTNIVIDDTLMMEALSVSDYKTKKETVEAALKLLIALKNQASIRNFRGKLFWNGDLEKMRLDKLLSQIHRFGLIM